MVRPVTVGAWPSMRPAVTRRWHTSARAAGRVQVGGHVAAARLQVGQQRRAVVDRVEVVDAQRDAGFVGDGDEVHHGVGGAAGGDDAGDGVLERRCA